MLVQLGHRESAAALRRRLLSPANAKPDLGIDLKRKPVPAVLAPPVAPAPIVEPAVVIARPVVPPPWLNGLIEFNEALRKLNHIASDAPRISMRTVRMVVAEHCEVTVADMDGASRRQIFTRPRFIAMFLCVRLIPVSVSLVAHTFGGRNHATAFHAIRCVREWIAGSVEFAHELDMLASRIRQLHGIDG